MGIDQLEQLFGRRSVARAPVAQEHCDFAGFRHWEEPFSQILRDENEQYVAARSATRLAQPGYLQSPATSIPSRESG
jgi:hypothetical protein